MEFGLFYELIAHGQLRIFERVRETRQSTQEPPMKNTLLTILGALLLCAGTFAQGADDCSSAQAITGCGLFAFDSDTLRGGTGEIRAWITAAAACARAGRVVDYVASHHAKVGLGFAVWPWDEAKQSA